MNKSKIVLIILLALVLTTFSTGLFAQNQPYAYVSISGKPFSKKLKVIVDFGDTPDQIAAGEKYSDLLTNKKSYAAILNYLVDNQFELVETLDYTSIGQGSGGTSGIVFIMRKKN